MSRFSIGWIGEALPVQLSIGVNETMTPLTLVSYRCQYYNIDLYRSVKEVFKTRADGTPKMERNVAKGFCQ